MGMSDCGLTPTQQFFSYIRQEEINLQWDDEVHFVIDQYASDIVDHSRFWLSSFDPLVFLFLKGFPVFWQRSWWLLQKRVMHTKLDIYVFIIFSLLYLMKSKFLELCNYLFMEGYCVGTGQSSYTVKPVLRGHLWDKEKVAL
jgi:hypothetical protein